MLQYIPVRLSLIYNTENNSILAKNINSIWYSISNGRYRDLPAAVTVAVGFPSALKLRQERVNAPSVNSRTSRLSVSFIGHPLPSTGHCSSSRFRPGPRCSSLTSSYLRYRRFCYLTGSLSWANTGLPHLQLVTRV